ncbi:MAG: hypothetical protein ACYC1D_14450 [Acidimicrobiales bacterium]
MSEPPGAKPFGRGGQVFRFLLAVQFGLPIAVLVVLPITYGWSSWLGEVVTLLIFLAPAAGILSPQSHYLDRRLGKQFPWLVAAGPVIFAVVLWGALTRSL